jgi:hypothetical protein
MYDQPLFLKTLSGSFAVLPARYDLESTLTEFTENVALVLRVFRSEITMADDPCGT